MCTKNHNQMRCSSWNMEWDRHSFLSFWAIFCTFTPLWTPKIKTWKKGQKTPGDIILLHMCTINEDHMMYGSWDKKTQHIVFCHFRQFCALSYTSHPKKSKFWKKAWKYHLTLKWHKWQSYYVWLLRYGAQKWFSG